MWLEIRGIFEADRYKEHRVEKKNLSWSSSSTAIPRFQKGRIWYAGNLRIAGACNQTIMGSAATKDGKNVVQTCRALTIQHYVENQFHIMHFRIVQLFSGSISFRYVDGHLVTTLWTFSFFFFVFPPGWPAMWLVRLAARRPQLSYRQSFSNPLFANRLEMLTITYRSTALFLDHKKKRRDKSAH